MAKLQVVSAHVLRTSDHDSSARRRARIRTQVAIARTLFDELERTVSWGNASPIDDQVIEELARTGCRILEAAAALAAEFDASESPPRAEARVRPRALHDVARLPRIERVPRP